MKQRQFNQKFFNSTQKKFVFFCVFYREKKSASSCTAQEISYHKCLHKYAFKHHHHHHQRTKSFFLLPYLFKSAWYQRKTEIKQLTSGLHTQTLSIFKKMDQLLPDLPCEIKKLTKIVMNETLKLNTDTGVKLRETVPSCQFLQCCITCPLQISSPQKTTSGLDEGL